MFLGLVVFGVIMGAVGTHVLLTGRLPCIHRQVLDATEVDDDQEARQVLQSGSNYFDDEGDGHDEPSDEEDDGGFVDAGGRIDSISTGLQ